MAGAPSPCWPKVQAVQGLAASLAATASAGVEALDDEERGVPVSYIISWVSGWISWSTKVSEIHA